MNNVCSFPVLGLAGWSGSGKTTLLEKLIPALNSRGIRVIVIKHDVHGLKTKRAADGTIQDVQGTDSWRFSNAGADRVILCSPDGPDLSNALKSAAELPDKYLILVEGFKRAQIPKIGICREANGKGFTAHLSEYIAVVTDLKIDGEAFDIPVFGLNDIENITDFIEEYYERFYTF